MSEEENPPNVRRQLSELSLLFEISPILERRIDLRLHDEAGAVLEAIGRHTNMMRGTLTLYSRQPGELYIEAAHGLSSFQQERGRYKPGDGVTRGWSRRAGP